MPQSISDIESELGYTPEDAKVIQTIKLVWQKLQVLRQKAERDPKFLAAYRDALDKGIQQSRSLRPMGDGDEIAERCRALWRWYDEQAGHLGVADLEMRRGLPHQEWCEKWLRKEYEAFSAAVNRLVENPSQRQIDDVRSAASVMLRAYVGAFR